MKSIETNNLGSVEEFEERVLRSLSETQQDPTNPILFRGQADAEWLLDSTLAREKKDEVAVDTYFERMLKIYKNAPDEYESKWPNFETEIKNLRINHIYDFTTEAANTRDILGFMVDLRHQGVSSPLLDWTLDPYVAVYFAFDLIPEKADRVAIYTFKQYSEAMSDMLEETEPTAIAIGHNIPGVSRHEKQKAYYTLCVRHGLGNNRDFKKAVFTGIESDMNRQGFSVDKDWCVAEFSAASNIVHKYTIPVSEQKKAKLKLKNKKINRCSLFGESEK